MYLDLTPQDRPKPSNQEISQWWATKTRYPPYKKIRRFLIFLSHQVRGMVGNKNPLPTLQENQEISPFPLTSIF